MISVRKCFSDDLTLLAEYNKRLIEDEKSDNPMDPAQLRGRMKRFLETDYAAYLFESDGIAIGYALGLQAFRLLLETLNTDSIDVEVLVWNTPALAFWKKMGFEERSLYMRRETPSGP